MELQRLLSLTRKAMDDYQMIQEGDKIAKDSSVKGYSNLKKMWADLEK